MLKKLFCSTFIATSSTLFCADTSKVPAEDINDTHSIETQRQVAALNALMKKDHPEEHMQKPERDPSQARPPFRAMPAPKPVRYFPRGKPPF